MTRLRWTSLAFGALLALSGAASAQFAGATGKLLPLASLPSGVRSLAGPAAGSPEVAVGYGKLPLAFEPNVGQTDARVRFLARGGGMMAFFTDTETVMVLGRAEQGDPGAQPLERRERAKIEQAVVRMKLTGAGLPRRTSGFEKLPGVSNYFIGNEPAKWHTDVPHYARVQYEGVYPGIDLVWYGNQRQLEYDFVVAPGADPGRIQVAYEGVESVGVDGSGELVLRTALGEVRQQRPRVYQEIGGKRVEVGARYSLLARNRVTFELAKYDRKRELRIDPLVLVYSTYLGGSLEDRGQGIAVDEAGSAYVAGFTLSTNFPTSSPYQGPQAVNNGEYDAFVTKLLVAGSSLVYSTYLGGTAPNSRSSRDSQAFGIAVDVSGSAYVTGLTYSTNFPTLAPFQATNRGFRNAFVTKLAPTGSALVYSTYLGGSQSDQGMAIALDAFNSAYITGQTNSPDFPVAAAYQGGSHAPTGGFGGTAFVTELTPSGNSLSYSTYLGGSSGEEGLGIAVDVDGSAFVTGWTISADFPTVFPFQAAKKTKAGWDTAFVTKLTPGGGGLFYSTFLGGSTQDVGYAIASDGTGSAYITGTTMSADFPIDLLGSPYQATLRGVRNAFVTKLSLGGTALDYSTYLGGNGNDYGYGIAVDTAGSAYVAGSTSSSNFPTLSPYATAGGTFVTKVAPSGSDLVYSTYFGGGGANAIALDTERSAYITGQTGAGLATMAPYQATFHGGPWDGFVSKFRWDAGPVLIAPANSATGVALAPTLSWNPSAGASSYDVYLGTTNPPPLFTNTTGTSYAPGAVTPLAAGATYYWQVVAWFANVTASSTVWSFTTLIPPPPAPALVSPANSATGVSLTPTLSWSASTGAVSYDVYFGTSSPPPLATNTTGTSFGPGALVPGTPYYWRVVAKNGGGSTSSFTWSFTTLVPAPAAPVLVLPAFGASGALVAPTLVWNPSTFAGSYDVYFGTSSPPPLVTNTTGTTYAPATLNSNTAYYWQIVARNGSGSGSSDTWLFTTGVPATGLRFVPVVPCRVADTRGASGTFGGPTMTAGSSRSFPVPQSGCGIPGTALAYSMNVTVVPQGPLYYLTLWPTGQSQAQVSTLNSWGGIVVANAAIVPAGTGGAVSVFVPNATDVILDINGYFDTSSGLNSFSFYPATPCRIADTRGPTGPFGGPTMYGGQTRDFSIASGSCGFPAAAQGYSLNVTVVPNGYLGYLSTWPTGQAPPVASTLNSWTGKVVANAALVPAGTNASISVYVSNPTDVILDGNGYFAAPGSAGALLFYPVTPCRVVDTRGPAGPFGGPEMGAGTTRSFAIPASGCNVPSNAAAYSVNVTVVPDARLSYLSAWPTGQAQANVSTLNSWDGSVVANAAIVPAGASGAISVYVTDATQVILDIDGYFAP